MILPNYIRQDVENSFKKFLLTDQQIKQAQLLTPETCAYYEHLATAQLETLTTLRFTGSAEEQQQQMRNHAYIVGRRELLLELLEEAHSAWHELQQAATVAGSNASGNFPSQVPSTTPTF